MEIGLGVLEWPPVHFWVSTPKEVNAAMRAWCDKNGIKPKNTDSFTDQEFKELVDKYGKC